MCEAALNAFVLTHAFPGQAEWRAFGLRKGASGNDGFFRCNSLGIWLGAVGGIYTWNLSGTFVNWLLNNEKEQTRMWVPVIYDCFLWKLIITIHGLACCL